MVTSVHVAPEGQSAGPVQSNAEWQPSSIIGSLGSPQPCTSQRQLVSAAHTEG